MNYIKLFLFILMPSCLCAQNNPAPALGMNKVFLGIGSASVDNPDGIGPLFTLGFGHSSKSRRLYFSGEIGYSTIKNEHLLAGSSTYIVGKRHSHIDLNPHVSFNFIRSQKHALYLGIGPSLAFKKDYLLNSVRYQLLPDGSSANIVADWKERRKTAVGYNIILAYNLTVHSRINISPYATFLDFGKEGQNTTLGLQIGYTL